MSVTAVIPAEDDLTQARAALEPFLERLRSRREVEAIVILSSAAKGGVRASFDRQSDIDMSVFVSVPHSPDEWRPTAKEFARALGDRIPGWLPNFSFTLPVPWGDVELNVHQLIYEYEADSRTVWKEAKREAYAYTREVVYDRSGRVANLIEARTRFDERERSARIPRLANRLEWDVRVHPERQATRGDVAGAHYMLNVACEELIEMIYVLSGRFVPHPKWRLQTIGRLGLIPPGEQELLEQAIAADPSSREDLLRRIEALEQIWAAVRRRAGAAIADDPYRFYSANVSGEQQLRTTTIADEIADTMPEARDLVNYLLPASRDDLASVLDAPDAELPERWRHVQASLRLALGG